VYDLGTRQGRVHEESVRACVRASVWTLTSGHPRTTWINQAEVEPHTRRKMFFRTSMTDINCLCSFSRDGATDDELLLLLLLLLLFHRRPATVPGPSYTRSFPFHLSPQYPLQPHLLLPTHPRPSSSASVKCNVMCALSLYTSERDARVCVHFNK
jgi:hypothetical protein